MDKSLAARRREFRAWVSSVLAFSRNVACWAQPVRAKSGARTMLKEWTPYKTCGAGALALLLCSFAARSQGTKSTKNPAPSPASPRSHSIHFGSGGAVEWMKGGSGSNVKGDQEGSKGKKYLQKVISKVQNLGRSQSKGDVLSGVAGNSLYNGLAPP